MYALVVDTEEKRHVENSRQPGWPFLRAVVFVNSVAACSRSPPLYAFGTPQKLHTLVAEYTLWERFAHIYPPRSNRG